MMLHRMGRRGAVTSVQRSLRVGAMPQRRNFHFGARDSSQSFSTAAGKPASANGSNRVASAASFFLDAKAACKGKRCALGKDHSGIGANPATCGEDSFFLTPDVVGVADGVGGWNENGVDPGKISRSLMRNAAAFVRQQAEKNESASTLQVLTHGYNQAVLDDEVEAGSTTACIVRLKPSPEGKPLLEYSNLGDSGFVVIRDGEIIFRSKFQYYGRAPYQLAKIPLRFKQYGAIENHPNDADSGEIDVQDGDLVVLATDGVWDNFAPDLQRAASHFPPVLSWRRYWSGELASFVEVIEENPDKAAENIVLASLRHNLKPDDITVVVAKVVVMASKLQVIFRPYQARVVVKKKVEELSVCPKDQRMARHPPNTTAEPSSAPSPDAPQRRRCRPGSARQSPKHSVFRKLLAAHPRRRTFSGTSGEFDDMLTLENSTAKSVQVFRGEAKGILHGIFFMLLLRFLLALVVAVGALGITALLILMVKEPDSSLVSYLLFY
ncbi:Protein phosphatase PTC7 [Phytophthora boehmeriae]|uniref:Protein phosphatase n=1 Tax=Phytophthora boehmeriae TaxID=109152 RepID=A0A8T1WEM9_9STRA|nr:Protein phosphatase PTC7 [Phytophthora boehmeriae]